MSGKSKSRVSSRSVEQLVAEGHCVDVSSIAKDMGFKTYVLFSLDLYDHCSLVGEVCEQVKDVLLAFKFAAAKRWSGESVSFEILFQTSISPSFKRSLCEGMVSADSRSQMFIYLFLSDANKR